jgi:hypothetical protein
MQLKGRLYTFYVTTVTWHLRGGHHMGRGRKAFHHRVLGYESYDYHTM